MFNRLRSWYRGWRQKRIAMKYLRSLTLPQRLKFVEKFNSSDPLDHNTMKLESGE